MTPPLCHRIAVHKIPDFWERLKHARAAFLALDYDGTLAPFHTERMRALPLAGVPELLERISAKTHGALAIVSGRPISEIETLLPVEGITVIGAHGYEIKHPLAKIIRRLPSPKQLRGLELADAAARRQGYASLLEIKTSSIALHTRGLSAADALDRKTKAAGTWGRLAREHGLTLRRFDGGIELLCLGRHKGDAVRELIDGLAAGTFFAYIGDDETDEDVFEILAGRGLGIRVGSDDRPSAAHGGLETTGDVRDFLSCWLELAPRADIRGGQSWISAD